MIEVSFIFLSTLLARAGGIKSVGHFVHGFIIGYYLTRDIVQSLIIAVAWLAGSAPALGEVIGSILMDKEMAKNDLENWQIGILGENKLLAMVSRGIMWAILPALAVYYTSGLVMAVFLFITTVISFTVSPYITQRLIKPKADKHFAPILWRAEIDANIGHSQLIAGFVFSLILIVGI